MTSSIVEHDFLKVLLISQWQKSTLVNTQAYLVDDKSSAAIVLPFLPPADTLTTQVYLYDFSHFTKQALIAQW